MSDALRHECGVAMVVLRRPPAAAGAFGGTKLSLLMEKQHNRGQDGAGAAIIAANPMPGEPPYWMAKSASATPLADVLAAIGKRCGDGRRGTRDDGAADMDGCPPHVHCLSSKSPERIFLGHLRYATFGKNDESFCHPFVHQASELGHTLLLAGNFNLTNTAELFEKYSQCGEFPTSKADGYLICELIAHELGGRPSPAAAAHGDARPPIASALSAALAGADGAWTLCGATGDGWAFATRDPHGIRPGFYYLDDDVAVVASERPAIQAAFDVPPEAVMEIPPGQALIISPDGEVQMAELSSAVKATPCSFERIYFSRANDADIHRERKALGAALLPSILKSAEADIPDIFFSYIPNSARIAFHGLLEELFSRASRPIPRFGEIIVKDAKFRTFIADAHSREEFYKHVYDVTYGLVRPGKDTLVVLDDSIVRGNTMRNAILPMLDRLGPKRIVIASSAPPIRYPDCYGIDMSTLGELVAFRALVSLLGANADGELARCLSQNLPLASLYARFTDEEHCAEIARLLTPPGMKAEVRVVYQTVANLRRCLAKDIRHPAPGTSASNSQPSTLDSQLADGGASGTAAIGDWYFTGDYPTPGGCRVLRRALENYLDRRSGRSY